MAQERRLLRELAVTAAILDVVRSAPIRKPLTAGQIAAGVLRKFAQ
jgi:hypothetical protein